MPPKKLANSRDRTGRSQVFFLFMRIIFIIFATVRIQNYKEGKIQIILSGNGNRCQKGKDAEAIMGNKVISVRQAALR
jgi:hypothetical protein